MGCIPERMLAEADVQLSLRGIDADISSEPEPLRKTPQPSVRNPRSEDRDVFAADAIDAGVCTGKLGERPS